MARVRGKISTVWRLVFVDFLEIINGTSGKNFTTTSSERYQTVLVGKFDLQGGNSL